MGAILAKAEAYFLDSEEGAILLIVESEELTADPRAIPPPNALSANDGPAKLNPYGGRPDQFLLNFTSLWTTGSLGTKRQQYATLAPTADFLTTSAVKRKLIPAGRLKGLER